MLTTINDAISSFAPPGASSNSLKAEFPLPINLDPTLKQPLFKQLAATLRDYIVNYDLMPGQVIPSTRDMSKLAGISRSTVIQCYNELLSQGYLKSVEGIGTFVTHRQLKSPPAVPSQRPVKISSLAQRCLDMEPTAAQPDWKELKLTSMPQDLLPLRQWRQVLWENMRSIEVEDFDFVDAPFGHPSLREAVAGYLARSRATRTSVDRVIVMPGTLSAFHLIARAFIDHGTYVAMENPGHHYARHVFEAQGANIVPIPIDSQGIIVSELDKVEQEIRFVYVTPSHHDPTGVVMSMDRRRQLLDWAKRTGAYIVEDDYDSEFRHAGMPLSSIQGLDEDDCVVYMSSFWKALFPLVDVGYMIVPASLAQVFWQVQVMRDSPLTTALLTVEQQTLADFISEGYLETSLRRNQSVLSGRWRSAVLAMTRHLKNMATWSAECSGLHVVVRFEAGHSSEQIMQHAKDANLPLMSTELYYVGTPKKNEFIMPFADAEPDEIDRRIEAFAQALNSSRHEFA
jgi:GntR family transcriptional regulator / MocR family aminotransferase